MYVLIYLKFILVDISNYSIVLVVIYGQIVKTVSLVQRLLLYLEGRSFAHLQFLAHSQTVSGVLHLVLVAPVHAQVRLSTISFGYWTNC